MIIDHTHPLYVKKRNLLDAEKYNGAYYYSKDIVKHIIPYIKTDRNWVTVNIPEIEEDLSHSIIFIHNNRNVYLYLYLKDFTDIICVCSTKITYNNFKAMGIGTPIYLPLSLDVKSIKRYKRKIKDKEIAFAGRRSKRTFYVDSSADLLCDMPQTELIKKMAHYKKIYAVGRTAIQAKILGCKLLPYDPFYPDVKMWNILDCKDAVKILQDELDKIDML